MIKPIVTSLQQLKLSCQEINLETEQELVQTIIKDLEDTLKDSGRGAGLAANQIGHQYKIAIIRGHFGDFNLINPKITEKENKTTSLEGCLSLPGIKLTVNRYNDIKIENNTYNTIDFKETLIAKGVLAIILQHEIAHLNSRTILDDKRRNR